MFGNHHILAILNSLTKHIHKIIIKYVLKLLLLTSVKATILNFKFDLRILQVTNTETSSLQN